MKKLITLFLLLLSPVLYAQNFQSNNMRMLKNLNQHPQGLYSALWGYTAPNGREYAALGCYTGTAFIDVTDTANIREVGFIPGLESNWREMKFYSHYAYIVSEAGGSKLQIVDLQYLPDSVRLVNTYSFGFYSRTHSISQEGKYLYLNGGDHMVGGTFVLDLTNPIAPVKRGEWETKYIHDLRAKNDTLWAANIYEGTISVIDARNKDSLKTITSFVNGQNPFPHNTALTKNSKHLFTTDETLTPPGKLKVWNINELQSPLLARVWSPTAFPNAVVHNIEIYDTIAVIGYYSAGVRVINIANPVHFYDIAWFDTHPENNSNNYEGCWGVYMFPSGKIIASDRQRGLFVLKVNSMNPNIQPGQPDADFTITTPTLKVDETCELFDISTGVPSSWQWTVTGPKNYSSTSQNFIFPIDTVGTFNVKLKVSNSFGGDSLVKTNHITVKGPVLNQYAIVQPSSNVTVMVNANDTSKYKFTWRSSNTHRYVRYKMNIRGLGYNLLQSSVNTGKDTTGVYSRQQLDSLITQYGGGRDSLVSSVRIYAYNGADSLVSTNTIIMIIKRGTVGITTTSQEIPNEFALGNNYPNPFNPVTSINYQVPEQSLVKIKVYDITGRLVASPVNEMHTPGFYKATFDASLLSSGVYFYEMNAGRFRQVKRMMLVK